MHIFPIRVYYEDTDMAGIVYYANYLRYIERARSHWVREVGVDQNAMRAAGVVFVVRRVEADYLVPARFEDDLVVETSIMKLTGVRMVFLQRVMKDGAPLFEALVTVACLNDAGRVVRLPAEIEVLQPPN
ncbi:MAG: tol-pal system-associated acyl-CoA thioesterase [Rhodobacteraceae bacterium]|nr:tol-pal system-associated acyl-CoA thioesterase [Paracoccaceae bacterium]